MSFYAVANGRTNGIFLNWSDCNTSVKGYSNASYKKFKTKEEAEQFITQMDTNCSEIGEIGEIDVITDYYVYTDGGCSNNGSINAVAGIGIFFGINDTRNVSQKLKFLECNQHVLF